MGRSGRPSVAKTASQRVERGMISDGVRQAPQGGWCGSGGWREGSEGSGSTGWVGAENVRWRRERRRRRIEKAKVGELEEGYMLKGGGLKRGSL